MEKGSLVERVHELLAKSRKAVRLYSSMAQSSKASDSQIAEWRSANQTLVRELTELLASPQTKTVGPGLYQIREIFLASWRDSEEELKKKHFELTKSAENGDYIKSSMLSQELVVLKARAQSSQAVSHEVGQIIEKSKVPPPSVESGSTIKLVAEVKTGAKVIEFPRRAVG